MNEQSGSVALVDVIAEFLEVALHMILFVRGIYPPELFESTQKYSCPIKTARHPGLKNYIQQIVQSIRAELIQDTIHRICVVTLDPSTKPIDRFVFEMSVLKAFEDQFQIAQPQLQQPIHASDSTHQLEHLDEEHQIEQPETNITRVDKGKGRALEYQHYDHKHQDMEDYDEDVDADVEGGGFEADNYEGHGGDHEQQELEENEDGNEQGEHNKHDHHDAGGAEGEGGEEEDYDGEEEEEDGGPPHVKRARIQDTNKATTADAVALAASRVAERRRNRYNSLAARSGDGERGQGRRQTPHFGARVDLTTDLEMMLRAMLLKISICDAHLAPLTPECSFTVVVEMKNKGAEPEAKADFPWSPISPASHQEQLKVSAPSAHPSPQRKIIPVKTIDLADIQLELYLEKFGN
ncbi:MAG: hypothetical protein J3R72DRAFT_63349 [Linnemannia gamsii]|nr:MAG: hypothetical protein J3R72DRAFT_63349 [Linnemannia gamsii]